MYSINLSLLSHSNYIPENAIVNVKQLSENVVRIQLAERLPSDKLPVVHTNSIKFSKTHEDSLVVDMSISSQGENYILKPKNFDPSNTEIIDRAKGFSILDVISDIAHIILKINDLAVDSGYSVD